MAPTGSGPDNSPSSARGSSSRRRTDRRASSRLTPRPTSSSASGPRSVTPRRASWPRPPGCFRPGGRLLVLHDYGRDDVSRLRGDLPEYGLMSRRDGPFLARRLQGSRRPLLLDLRLARGGRAFLDAAFGDVGRGVAAEMSRPRLSYNVAVYHRTLRSHGDDRLSAARPAEHLAGASCSSRVALIGSVVFALYAITVRDASQIPLLASGAVVLGIVFMALAAYALRATWRAGIDERNGRRSRSARRRASRRSSGPAASPARSSCSCCRSHRPEGRLQPDAAVVEPVETLW